MARPNRIYEILDNHTTIPESGCWIWLGATNQAGYGQASIFGSKQLVHRLAYLVKTGEMPYGKKVMHKCDIPCCINPEHLEAGTQRENMEDMIAKGRGSWQKQ